MKIKFMSTEKIQGETRQWFKVIGQTEFIGDEFALHGESLDLIDFEGSPIDPINDHEGIRDALISFSEASKDSAKDFHSLQKELGLTNTEVAKFLGVNLSTIGNYRSGKKRAPKAVIMSLKYLKRYGYID